MSVLPTQAVVINLERRPDRLAAFRAEWDRLKLPLRLDVVAATDGRVAHERYGDFAYQMACTHSHWRALAGYTEPVLVLEDDVIFADATQQQLEQVQMPQRWDMLYLGGQHTQQPDNDDAIVRVKAFIFTHAYIVNTPQRVAYTLKARLNENIERIYNSMPLTRYAMNPFIAGQAAGVSDIGRNRDRDLLMPLLRTPTTSRS